MIGSAAPHILVVTTRADVTADYVVLRLADRGEKCFRLNTEDLPEHSTSSFGANADSLWWEWESGGLCVDLSEVRAVWYRRHRLPLMNAALSEGEKDFCLRESDWFLRGALLSRNVRWMSHPSAVTAAEAKLFQLAIAREIGLRVPATLITNDPVRARRFVESNGVAIAKAIRTGYVDDGLSGRAIFSNRISAADIEGCDESIRLSPVIFQQFIEKTCDVRVTIVDDKLFAARIDSQGVESARVDWRRSESDNLPHSRIDLPPQVAAGCIRLVQRLGLTFGAVDLVIDEKGEWYFLEINPTGQWAWLEDKLGFDISGSIADWLSQAIQRTE